MRGLRDKRVLITGGAGGIGTATAARFLKEGSRVVVLDCDDAARRRLERELPALSGSIGADVSDPDDVARAFEDLDDLLGGLDVLINNAGISIRHRFIDISAQEWREVMEVNLNGVFFVAQQAARRMLAGGGGVILNMGSTNGLMGYPYYADYNASKRRLPRVHSDADAGSRIFAGNAASLCQQGASGQAGPAGRRGRPFCLSGLRRGELYHGAIFRG